MDILWAPWRSSYIQSFKDEDKTDVPKPCFLCQANGFEGNMDDALVVARFGLCFAILNKFPYNSGHLLIAPYRHVAELKDLTPEELSEMMEDVRLSISVIDKIYTPHGYNIGINIGRVAGAGVPGHIHIHIVPRWNGDTSFISVISDTKVVSQSLDEIQKIFAEEFKKID